MIQAKMTPNYRGNIVVVAQLQFKQYFVKFCFTLIKKKKNL